MLFLNVCFLLCCFCFILNDISFVCLFVCPPPNMCAPSCLLSATSSLVKSEHTPKCTAIHFTSHIVRLQLHCTILLKLKLHLSISLYCIKVKSQYTPKCIALHFTSLIAIHCTRLRIQLHCTVLLYCIKFKSQHTPKCTALHFASCIAIYCTRLRIQLHCTILLYCI